MFKPYYDIRGKIGAKDLLPLTSASTLANKVLDMGLIDMMMFSINPMYDYGQGDFSIGSNAERYELYSRCEKKRRWNLRHEAIQCRTAEAEPVIP